MLWYLFTIGLFLIAVVLWAILFTLRLRKADPSYDFSDGEITFYPGAYGG